MKEMTKGKRLLSILLCFVMMLSLVPMTAFAATALYNLMVRVENAVGGNVEIKEKGGQGTVASESDISLDASRTVNFYPASGYEIDSVTVNYTPVRVANNKLELKMDENKTVVVRFKQIGGTSATTGGTSFKVLKTDDSSTPKTLGSARFVLTGTGNTSGEYTAISSLYGGIATFENIPDGTYTLYESVAPYGYVKTNETCTVTIDAKTNANNPITIAIDPTTTASDITIAQSAVGNTPGTFANGNTIATFKNTKAETKTVELKIEKTVDGATPPAGVDFDFKIERIIGVDSNGDPIFDRAGGNYIRGVAPGETKTDSREYPVNEFENLVISEVILNNDAGWTYDESVYKIIITTDANNNVIGVKYSKIDTPLDQFDVAKFTNTYTEYSMDGIGHWPVGEPNDKEDHADNNQDGICDICGFNTPPTPGGGPGNTNTGNKPNPDTGVLADAPQTGDNGNVFLWIVLSLVSGLALVGTALYGRKKRATK